MSLPTDSAGMELCRRLEAENARLRKALVAISKNHLVCINCFYHDKEEGDWPAEQDSNAEWDLYCPNCGSRHDIWIEADEIASAALSDKEGA